MYVLSEQQGLLLRALQPLEEEEDEEKVSRQAGDHWLIRGPLEYVPSAKVEVVEERQAIPLDENEGIYVQDVKTGKVTAEGWALSLLCCHGGGCSGHVGDADGGGAWRRRRGDVNNMIAAAETLAGRYQGILWSVCLSFVLNI